VDETSVKVKQTWMDLYRAVDSQGNTLEFLLSATRDAEAAKRFFSKALAASHTMTPRVITVDKHAAYPKAFKELKAEGLFQNPVHGGPSSISTLSSSKTIVSSNDSSNLGWVSFHSSARGEPCKDRR
jgi:transposase-like protein